MRPVLSAVAFPLLPGAAILVCLLALPSAWPAVAAAFTRDLPTVGLAVSVCAAVAVLLGVRRL